MAIVIFKSDDEPTGILQAPLDTLENIGLAAAGVLKFTDPEVMNLSDAYAAAVAGLTEQAVEMGLQGAELMGALMRAANQ